MAPLLAPPPGARCELCPAARPGGLPGKKCTPATDAPDPHIRLAIVAEMPSTVDEFHGLLSADYSGGVFWRGIRAAGFRREEVYVTAAALCRPRAVKKDLPAAAYACAPRLARELAALPADVPIVTLGTTAEGILTGHANIAKGRGFIWRVPEWRKQPRPKPPKEGDPRSATKARAHLLGQAKWEVRSTLAGRAVLPTLDPRQVARAQPTWWPLIGRDLRRVRRWVDGGSAKPPEDEGEQTVCSTPEELAAELGGYGRGGAWGSEVVVDVETAGKDPMTTPLQMVGVCDTATLRVVQAYPWTPAMAPILAAFLEGRTVVWHNGLSFDHLVLRRYGVDVKCSHDTLVMHHAMASHLRQSLDHCAANYCDAGPWKLRHRGQTVDDKGGFGVRPEELSVYNGADVRLNALVWRRMSAEIEAKDRAVYEGDMRLADVARRMRVHGMAIDEARRQALIRSCREREVALLGELRGVIGDVKFDPAKAAHIRSVLYRNRPARRTTPTGESATDRGALEAMIAEGGDHGRIADLVLRWRSARDARAEYLEALQPLNGRVHAGWRMPSTDTGRPACREPNFLNMPRLPHCRGCGVALLDGAKHGPRCTDPDPAEPAGQIRDIYVAAPGHVFVYFDLSQAEMRFAAHIYGDEPMMAACQADVHAGNAQVLFPDVAEIIRTDPKGRGKPYRDIAKNIGFAIAYLAQAGTVYEYLRAHLRGFAGTPAEVEAMLTRLHVAYKHYYAWVEYQYRYVKKYGYLRTVWSGRKRTFGRFRVSKPEVANYHIQAGVADVMNAAIIHFDAALPPEVRLVMFAYDCLIFEAPKHLAEYVQERIVERWVVPLRVPAWPASGEKEITFVQPIDVHVGERLSEL